MLVGIGVQAVIEEERTNSTRPTGAVEKKKHSSAQHVLRKWRTRSGTTQSVETMTEMPHRTIQRFWTSAETKGTGQIKFAKVELHVTKVLHQHRGLSKPRQIRPWVIIMAPPYLQATRMSIDAFMCLTKKERSGMMQTKIRPKAIAKQLQNTKVSRFAVVPDQCQVLVFFFF